MLGDPLSAVSQFGFAVRESCIGRGEILLRVLQILGQRAAAFIALGYAAGEIGDPLVQRPRLGDFRSEGVDFNLYLRQSGRRRVFSCDRSFEG